MADRLEFRTVTVAANTTQQAPTIQDVSFAQGNVVAIEIIVPDGHAGLTGLALAQSHQIIIPFTGTTWIQTNDEKITFDWTDVLQNGSWQVYCFNVDLAYQHAFYVRFFINELAARAPVSIPRPISAAEIVASGSPASQAPQETPQAPEVAGTEAPAISDVAPGEFQSPPMVDLTVTAPATAVQDLAPVAIVSLPDTPTPTVSAERAAVAPQVTLASVDLSGAEARAAAGLE